MTHLNSSPLNHEKVQKSPPHFFELPDYPDVALPHTINVRNTSSLFSRCDSLSHRLALLTQHLFKTIIHKSKNLRTMAADMYAKMYYHAHVDSNEATP